jgi:hypothetical protein
MKKLMMMVLMMCLTIVSFGQDSLFTLNQSGLTDYVITNCDGKTQNELYKKTLDWVLVTYNTPSSVIKAQIENNYIRIEGSARYLVRTGGWFADSYLTKYQIEISFKDNKYKFDILNIEIYVRSSQYTVGGWHDFNLTERFKTKSYLNDYGEVRPSYKYYHEIPSYFNSLNMSLKNFIQNENTPSKSKDW